MGEKEYVEEWIKHEIKKAKEELQMLWKKKSDVSIAYSKNMERYKGDEMKLRLLKSQTKERMKDINYHIRIQEGQIKTLIKKLEDLKRGQTTL